MKPATILAGRFEAADMASRFARIVALSQPKGRQVGEWYFHALRQYVPVQMIVTGAWATAGSLAVASTSAWRKSPERSWRRPNSAAPKWETPAARPGGFFTPGTPLPGRSVQTT